MIVAVIVLSTWLDYFPTRIKSLELRYNFVNCVFDTCHYEILIRESDGQGLPIGCLFCPMVCLGVMCYATDKQPELICELCVCVCVCDCVCVRVCDS